MIKELSSSLASFKNLTFKPGLNVLLAQKSRGASDRQTRNGAGKSSLVELIHFLLGSNADKDHFLRAPELAEESFQLTFDLGDQRVGVERAVATDKEVVVKGDTSMWPRQPKMSKKTARYALTNNDWRVVLGSLMFGLANDDGDDEDEASTQPYGPSFRMLFSYFARRQNAGGFFKPEQSSVKQQPWDQQVALTYLLGLDASVPQALQEIRTRERALAELKKAAKGDTLGKVIGKASDLRTQLAVQEARVQRLKDQLASFQVVPQYRELEQEASALTKQLGELANENTIDTQALQQLSDAMRNENPPRFADVRKAYEEAGVSLPGLVKKRFEDVERFHQSVVENRRSHLQGEIKAAEQRIEERNAKKQKLGARRAEIMMILKSGGALESFARLQTEAAKQEAQAEYLRLRYEAADALERNTAELGVERAHLHKRLQDDHREQSSTITDAILIFESLSHDLYEEAGSLTVSDTPNGPKFEVKIEAARSKGINNMQIFCFDMMLMELCIKRGIGPGFLIHDSHLFDGVDERQVARALEIGAARAKKFGFQYIVTLNQDAVPRKAFSEGFDFALFARSGDGSSSYRQDA